MALSFYSGRLLFLLYSRFCRKCKFRTQPCEYRYPQVTTLPGDIAMVLFIYTVDFDMCICTSVTLWYMYRYKNSRTVQWFIFILGRIMNHGLVMMPLLNVKVTGKRSRSQKPNSKNYCIHNNSQTIQQVLSILRRMHDRPCF